MALESQSSQKPKKDSWFSRFIERLAAANEKQFGGQVPDCCSGKSHLAKDRAVHHGRQAR